MRQTAERRLYMLGQTLFRFFLLPKGNKKFGHPYQTCICMVLSWALIAFVLPACIEATQDEQLLDGFLAVCSSAFSDEGEANSLVDHKSHLTECVWRLFKKRLLLCWTSPSACSAYWRASFGSANVVFWTEKAGKVGLPVASGDILPTCKHIEEHFVPFDEAKGQIACKHGLRNWISLLFQTSRWQNVDAE